MRVEITSIRDPKAYILLELGVLGMLSEDRANATCSVHRRVFGELKKKMNAPDILLFEGIFI